MYVLKKSFQIFFRDLRRLAGNPVALVVLIGITILPSLYAWVNIAANMDPYGNTSGIKVAVVNNDKEAIEKDLAINAGKEITDNLEQNDQLGWEFVSEENAIQGVKSGKYYAAIVIPDNFSSSLVSVLSGKIEIPELKYYINEKPNAVAPKITDAGATTIQAQINSTFSSVASESVSKILKTAVGNVSDTVTSVNSEITEMLDKTQKNIEEYQILLDTFHTHADNSKSLISNTQGTSDNLKTAAQSSASALKDADTLLQDTRTAAGSFSSVLSKSLSDGELLLHEANSSASAGLTDLENKADKINGHVGNALDSINTVVDLNGQILEKMEEINSTISQVLPVVPEEIQTAIDKLQEHNQSNKELMDSLTASNEGIANAVSVTGSAREQLTSLTKENLNQLHALRSSLNESVLPSLNQSLDAISALTGELSGTLNHVPASAEQLKGALTQLETGLEDARTALDSTQDALAKIHEDLDTVRTDVNAIVSSDSFQKFLSLEGIDAESISSFMASPAEIETKTFYAMENYGSGMAPFYTNLAIWVGGIVLIAILKLEVDKDKKVPSFRPVSGFFGRWLLFVFIGVFQGLIVCAGDIWLLKIQCKHPVALLAAGMLCSFVYVTIIYVLSLTFKHIGKALAVILVILQIPGSSGTFPVEMTPVFFQKLHPLLPFTYGVGAMRECIAGMYGNTYAKDMLILFCYIPIFLLLGLGLRPLLAGLNHLFDLKLSETEFMISDTPDKEPGRSAQLSLLLKASLSQEELQLQTTRKAQAFEKNYRKMIRLGFLAILIIPLLFLILMFSLESKLIFLVLWIISIIAICLWLIIIEYIHTKLTEQQQLAGMSFEEMLETFRRKEND